MVSLSLLDEIVKKKKNNRSCNLSFPYFMIKQFELIYFYQLFLAEYTRDHRFRNDLPQGKYRYGVKKNRPTKNSGNIFLSDEI